MGIKFLCPNGHKLHVKNFLASQRGVCPHCGEKFIIPAQSIPDIRVESLGIKENRRTAAIPRDVVEANLPDNLVDDTEAEAAPNSPAAAPTSAMAVAPVAAATGIAQREPVGEPQPAPFDVIAEAPAAVWYVRIPSGEQFGPAQGDMMRRWLVEGRVAVDALIWREGWAEWSVAGKVFPQLAQSVGPPQIGPGHLTAFEQGLAEQVETLVTPAQSAPDAAAMSSVALASRPVTSVLDTRRRVRSNSRVAITVLLVAVACLIPVVLLVLMRQ